MENDNAVIVIGIFLGICLAALLIVKIVEFFTEFNDVVRYLIGEMRRTGDDDEYRYWRRELRCHYLCLIPFVNERNVMRVYKKVFYKPKHNAPVKRTDGIFLVLAPSVIGIAVCALCLCGTSWAWFTSTTSAGTSTIKSATFQISDVQIIDDNNLTVFPGEDDKYTLAQGTYTLSFKAADGNTSSKGYCCITVYKSGETAGTNYYTNNIGNENPYTITVVNNENEIVVKIEAFWGDVANILTDETTKIASGETITVGTAVQNYVINKASFYNKLKTFREKVNIYPRILKFVTCDVASQFSFQGASSGEIGTQYQYQIGFYWDSKTKTMYIAPYDANDSTSVVCAPADSSDLLSKTYLGGSVTSIDCSNLDTSKVTNMSSMFSGLTNLTDLTFGSRFDTSNVTDMSSMFSGDTALTSLDLSCFETSSVTNMSKMFEKCSSLSTITVASGFNTDSVVSGYDTGMFAGCTSLVGGTGTKFDTTKVDKSYAKIDGGTDDSGYFTGANN